MSTSSADRNPVEELAEEFAERYRRGERPPLTEYVEKYPRYADEIRELFPALVIMEQLKPAAADATGAFEGQPAPAEARPPERLGDYRLLREVGRGGMGVVYEAEQVSLGRRVALKVLPPHALLNPTYLERFRREAKAAAKLHHTNIVPVFGVGEEEGVHFYAMQFIRGEGLDRVLHDLRRLRHAPGGAVLPTGSVASERSVAHGLLAGEFAEPATVRAEIPGGPADTAPLPNVEPRLSGSLSAAGTDAAYYRSVARVGLQVADALSYAHRQGVLHRDVKPSNLLMDAQGTVWITDFGLAKADGTDELTHTGDIVGTLRFMAPERFDGRSLPQSDVYGLGLTLYELLTLRPAFDNTNKARLIEKVLHEPTVPPRRLNPRVPRDLETVVLKGVAKDPSERYATAEEMAEDLRRFLVGEPIRARRVGTSERVVKWARRHPAAAALAGVSGLAALALVGLAVGLWYNGQLQGALREAKEQRAEADRQRTRAQALEANALYLRDINLVQQAWQEARVTQMRTLLQRWRAGAPDEPDLRGWEWYYLRGLCHTEFRTLEMSEPGEFANVAFHPDSRRIAVADANHKVHVWDVVDGRKLHTLTGHASVVDAVAFSPDGRMLASASWDGTVRVWDTGNGQQTHFFPANVRFRGVAFSPDGKHLAAAATDGTATLWAMPGGALVRRFVGHSNVVMMCVTFSPDGRLLATGDVDKTARIWDVASGECLRTLAGHTRQVSGVAFSPDGQTLATSSEDYSIKLWDWAAGEVRWTLEGHTAWVYRVAFSPDGRWLASVSDDMTVRLWDVARGKEASIFRGHEGRYVRGVAFSPDGRFLATTSGAPTSAPGANTVKVWDLTSVPQVYRALDPRTRERVRSVAFSADGRRLASAGRDRAVRLWDVFSGRQTHVLTGHTAEVLGVAIGSRDKLLASCGYDGTVRLWDADSGRLVRTLTDHRGPVTAVAFSPDGRQLAAAGEDRTVIVWEAESGRLVHTLAGHREAVVNIAFSPDGRRLASASNDRTVKLWDTETGEELQTLQGFTQKWRPLAFSPDGSQLATAGSGGTDAVQLWDTASGKSIRNLAGLWGGIYAVAFSPDGRRVVAGGPDAKVKVWDTASGQEVLTLQVPSGEISCVAFSPDGRWLAAAGAKSPPIQLWEAPPESRTEPEDRAALLTPEYVLRWHLDAAEDCLQAGQRPAARWHVDRLGHPALTDPLLYARLAGIRAKFGLWAEVIADAEAALRQQPDNADARCLRGLACQKLGHHADAVADFSALLTRHPCSAQLYELRAASHEALGQGDLARADREQAIKLGGKNPMVLNNEAWRLVAGPAGQRDPAKALDLIQQALKLAPDSATFLNTLGVVQYRNGQYKEAVNTLEKSRAAGQGRHDAFDLFFLAMCHARLGDAAKAKDCFDRAVRWTEAQKNLPAQHAEELKAFRAEAEGVLHRK